MSSGVKYIGKEQKIKPLPGQQLFPFEAAVALCLMCSSPTIRSYQGDKSEIRLDCPACGAWRWEGKSWRQGK